MSEPELLTDHHFYLFGYIVHQCAVIESGLNFYISDFLCVDTVVAGIITKPYTARQFRNVVSSLLALENRDQLNTELKHLLGEFNRISKFRNLIAHSRWKKGTRPNSIKPMSIEINDNKLKFKGMQEDEKDYTLQDIEEYGVSAEKLRSDFLAFYKRHKVSHFGNPALAEKDE